MNSEKFDRAVELIKFGNKQAALPLLKELVQANPDNEKAWLWLSSCLEKIEQKKYCLQQALRINPDNQNANAALSKLESQMPPIPQTPVETKDPTSPAISQAQPTPKRESSRRAQSKASRPSLSQLGGITILLLVLICIVVFGGGWVYRGLASTDQFIPVLVESQGVNTSSPLLTVLPNSSTLTSSPFLPGTLRPSFTPYPTNTAFVLFTWTPTKKPPTPTFTSTPYQPPIQINTNSPKTIKQTKQADGGGSDSSPTEPPPATLSSGESPYDIPTGNVVPSKTQGSTYTITCNVSPSVIQVGTNTPLTISARLYINGSATTTVALVAEWKDGQGRDFHCTSTGSSCQGQSGYFSGNDTSTVEVGASAPDGTRRTCQTTFGTN